LASIGGRGGAQSYEASQEIMANVVQTKRLFRATIMRAIGVDIRHSIWQATASDVQNSCTVARLQTNRTFELIAAPCLCLLGSLKLVDFLSR
jgi:hypothetical protein